MLREEQIDIRRQRAPRRPVPASRTSAATASSATTRSPTPTPAASTASPSAASTSATTPARAPTSAPTRSAPASTSRPSSPSLRRRGARRSVRQPQGRRHPPRDLPALRRAAARRPAPAAAPLRHARASWPSAFFDLKGLWKGGDDYERLIEVVEQVPEQVTIFSDAMEFIDREIERREMARARGRSWLAGARRAASCPRLLHDLLKVAALPLPAARGASSPPAAGGASSATTWAWARRCRRWPPPSCWPASAASSACWSSPRRR